MKGFKLDERGDVQITNGVIDLVADEELTAQTIRTVIGTNRGEWFMNEDEGIDFNYMLGKNITEDMQRSQIAHGIRQVDDTFSITDFSREIDSITRKATIRFTAQNSEDVVIASERSYE